ncbi:hypothetical protein GP486_005031, partial [Trichoglossum hirsutum]
MSNQPSVRIPPAVHQATAIFLATRTGPIPYIQNCFPRQGSPAYNPREVKRAFQTVTAYLRRHNVGAADAYATDDAGGCSVVCVRSVYRGPPTCERWFHDLQTTIADNFHCVRRTVFLDGGGEIVVAFMGIKENAASAALAFER